MRAEVTAPAGWAAALITLISAGIILIILTAARSTPPSGLVFSQFERPSGRTVIYLDPFSGATVEREDAVHDQSAAEIPLEPAPRSLDGTRTIMPRVTADGVDLFVENAGGATVQITRLQDFPPAGRTVREMRSNTSPLWSPDGQWISFISSDPLAHMDLYLVTAEGGGLRRIYEDVSTPMPLGLRWLPLPEQPFQPVLALAGLAATTAAFLMFWRTKGRRAG